MGAARNYSAHGLTVKLTFNCSTDHHSKKRLKNTYLNTTAWKNNFKKLQLMFFSFQNHCKTLIFEQYYERVLKYDVIFPWLNSNLYFRSKEHNQKRVKTTCLNTMDWKIKEKNLNHSNMLLIAIFFLAAARRPASELVTM